MKVNFTRLCNARRCHCALKWDRWLRWRTECLFNGSAKRRKATLMTGVGFAEDAKKDDRILDNLFCNAVRWFYFEEKAFTS